MRDAFHDDLDAVRVTLVEMSGLVGNAMERATTALLTADLKIAEEVISDDSKIDALHRELDNRILGIMARQQPVAGDLRTLVTSIRMSADLERMGDLADHIAKVARMRYPSTAIPPELILTIQEMGNVVKLIIEKTGSVIGSQDIAVALQLEKDDDEMDELHKKVIIGITNNGGGITIESAIDLTLLGRYYERFADHAVAVARRVYFLVNGEFPA